MQRIHYAANQAIQNTDQNDQRGFEYVKQPKEEFNCPLCSSVLKDAYEIESCGHVFCKLCLYKMILE